MLIGLNRLTKRVSKIIANDRRGFTLLEVVLAMTMLAVIAVPLAATIHFTLHSSARLAEAVASVVQEEQAVILAQGALEEQLARKFSHMASRNENVNIDNDNNTGVTIGTEQGIDFIVTVHLTPRQWNLTEIEAVVMWDSNESGTIAAPDDRTAALVTQRALRQVR